MRFGVPKGFFRKPLLWPWWDETLWSVPYTSFGWEVFPRRWSWDSSWHFHFPRHQDQGETQPNMRKLDVSACHELKNGDEHEPAEANTSPDFDWFLFHQVEQTPHHGTSSGHWLRRRWSGCAHQLDEWLEPAISWTCHTWLLICWWNSVVWATICDATYWIIEHGHWVLISFTDLESWFGEDECDIPRTSQGVAISKLQRLQGFFWENRKDTTEATWCFPPKPRPNWKLPLCGGAGQIDHPVGGSIIGYTWRDTTHHWKQTGSCSFDVPGYLRLPRPFSQKKHYCWVGRRIMKNKALIQIWLIQIRKRQVIEQSPEVLRLKSMRRQYWTYQSSGQMWTTTSGMKSFQDPSNMSCICFVEEIKWMYMKHGPEAIFRAILWIMRQKLWSQTCSLFWPGLKHQRPRTGWANAGWHPHQHLWMSRTRGMCE